jgi:hypothetical protein
METSKVIEVQLRMKVSAMSTQEKDNHWLDRWEWTDNILRKNNSSRELWDSIAELWQDSNIFNARLKLLKFHETLKSVDAIKHVEEMIVLL